jgi:hypothetical protein
MAWRAAYSLDTLRNQVSWPFYKLSDKLCSIYIYTRHRQPNNKYYHQYIHAHYYSASLLQPAFFYFLSVLPLQDGRGLRKTCSYIHGQSLTLRQAVLRSGYMTIGGRLLSRYRLRTVRNQLFSYPQPTTSNLNRLASLLFGKIVFLVKAIGSWGYYIRLVHQKQGVLYG